MNKRKLSALFPLLLAIAMSALLYGCGAGEEKVPAKVSKIAEDYAGANEIVSLQFKENRDVTEQIKQIGRFRTIEDAHIEVYDFSYRSDEDTGDDEIVNDVLLALKIGSSYVDLENSVYPLAVYNDTWGNLVISNAKDTWVDQEEIEAAPEVDPRCKVEIGSLNNRNEVLLKLEFGGETAETTK